ncbi:hypothetical protein BGZ46_000593 [Entomortierella lignicola]|nr:hypothetical protein BGZ46_000593 [Entomortierella lignicola]
MKKRGITKAVAKGKGNKATKDELDTSKTGDKRQIPLDFSRHAVVNSNSKKISVTQENATKNNDATQSDWSKLSADNPCILDPPVIRVSLVASKASASSTDMETRYPIETGTVETAKDSLTLRSYEDQEIYDEDDDEDDSPLKRSRSFRGSGSNNYMEHEDDDSSEVEVKVEDMAIPEYLKMEHESDSVDMKNPDMILPSQFRWRTVYVAAFELALDTVLPEEAFLFTDEEHTLFETYRALEDDPKHLFVRLFLRNQTYWQRQCKLEGRYREINDLESSIQQLIRVGLLMDQKTIENSEEAIAMLNMDELKILARRIGIIEKLSGKQRQMIVSTILEHFRQQSFLSTRLLLAPGGAADGGGASRKTGLATRMISGDATKRDNALIDKIVDISGPCFKIYPSIIKIFERLHLVFHRTREYNEKPALLEAILAKIGQRTFPSYEITRTNTVFRNRDELLKYEAAIKLHFDLSKKIESAMGAGKEATVYVRGGDQETRSAGGANGITNRRPNTRPPFKKTTGVEVDGASTDRWVYTQILRLELRAFAFLKRFEEESILLHELLDQHIYSLGQRGSWYDRLALIKSNYAFQKRLGKKEALEVCMMALRDKHVHAVDATLIQARIVRLESELKVAFRERHDFSYLSLRKAQTRILTGERLNAPGTAAPSYASSHSYSYVPNSMGASSHPIAQQRPLWRNIDGSDCGVEELALSYYGTLGYKGYHSENSILATLFGLLFWDILFSPQPGVFETSYQTEPLDLRTDAFFLQRQSMILGRINNISKSKIISEKEESIIEDSRREEEEEEEEETLVNRRRQQKANSTTNNSAANKELMENTLFEEEIKQELEQDDAYYSEEQKAEIQHRAFLARKRKECFYLDLLQRHDDLYREKKTFCVGVNWTFTKEELLQIAECIGGPALSEICRVMAQEYSRRCSGMPDLCCWDYRKKLVKFVEVKGPGDRLSSKQKIWIDLLTSLGVDIELCIVQVSKDEDAFLEERNALN